MHNTSAVVNNSERKRLSVGENSQIAHMHIAFFVFSCNIL